MVVNGVSLISYDCEKCQVDLFGERKLDFSLTFQEDDIEPLFSGGCWAGTVVWDAAMLLAQYLKEEVAITDKNVIELGSGIGLPGIACSFMKCKSVLLTEQPPLPKLIQKNINRIFTDEICKTFVKPRVVTLDWNEPDEVLQKGEVFDIILISDCIFEGLYGDSWKALASCIDKLAVRGKTRVFNAVERRREDGVKEFLELCESMGFSYTLRKSVLRNELNMIEIYEMYA